MVLIQSLITALVHLATTVSALPTDLAKRTETITASGTGTYGGYYYSNYVETGTDSLTLGTGTYSLSWTTAATDVVAGIGWETGAAR